ncbi:MAG: carbohydrate kinase [Gammaproteobacteria bacterium]|nr:carbohydrate kinase [Gammaproteobacteria bacterium]
MLRYVAVVDLGKTNSKVAVVDTSIAEEVFVVKQAAVVKKDDLYPCLDHEVIEQFIVESLRSLAGRYVIDAITITTHGATAALIDAAGELVLPVLDYEFSGVDDLRSQYEPQRSEFAVTGSPPLPDGLNIGAQLYWQQSVFPELFSRVRWVLTWPQYWVYRLSGEIHNDVTSLGCHTDLYEPVNSRYSALVDELGWHSIMPPLARSGSLSGTLTAAMSSRTQLPADLPVYTGIHDSNASLVPHLQAQSVPFSVVSTGTWFIAMAVGGSVPELDETQDMLLNVNARGESVPTARFMGGRERELLAPSVDSADIGEQTLDQFLHNEDSPALLMPSMVQRTGPFPDARSAWLGTSVDNDPELHSCAVAFYLALMTDQCLQLVGSDGQIFIEGPLAQDHLYTRMLSAVSDQTVSLSDTQTGTSVGAAMLISEPDKAPEYQRVTLDSDRREQLRHYASEWQAQLRLHVK